MAQAVYSKQQQKDAERLVAIADRWAEGYDRKSGVRFVSFTSRRAPKNGERPAVYCTRTDGQGCTCPGARESRSGRCFHQLAVSTLTERVREEAAQPSKRYEDIYGLEDAF